MGSSLNAAEIQQRIPHREPFLWLDEIVSYDGTKLHARKTLSPDLDVFRGHYPHFPVFPGVLLCEAAMQAAAVLISTILPPGGEEIPVATRMNDVQFRQMVRPGDTLDIEVEITERLANAFFVRGKVSANGKVSVRLNFAVAGAKPET
jgi:3-hydroxyacyl-[acyl-carrier-protein] dehydratase